MRWCDRDSNLIPSGAEQAEPAEQKAAQLAEKLRALGVDPETIE